MTLNEYQRLAARTINTQITLHDREMHALFGMCGETGEIHSIYQKVYQGHAINTDELQKEVGDLLWFVAEFCTAAGWNMGDIAQRNIDKLKKRYPNGFDAERSVNREKYPEDITCGLVEDN